VLVEPGKLGASFFSEHYSDSSDVINQALNFKGFGKIISAENSESIGLLCDNMLIEFMKKAKSIALGPEPLIAHYFAREFEMMNIRIILTGRLNALPTETIRERLRVSYE
jgi:vacuolar-type H+-ATPase subunit C/Vma6